MKKSVDMQRLSIPEEPNEETATKPLQTARNVAGKSLMYVNHSEQGSRIRGGRSKTLNQSMSSS
jgi:hypothetical protein